MDVSEMTIKMRKIRDKYDDISFKALEKNLRQRSEAKINPDH